MTVENVGYKADVKDFLASHGMVPVLCVSLDTLFVRKHLVSAAEGWYAATGAVYQPACVYNDTSRCEQPHPGAMNRAYGRCVAARKRGVE